MSFTTLTNIPSTQPSCGDISVQHPSPLCPIDNSSVTNDPMGCFIQKNGLFCAPISTTRGFLFTLDSIFYLNTIDNSTATTLVPHIIPILSVATNDNNTNPSPPLLGVDGQPINYQSPVRLGQTCIGMHLPQPPDPLFQTLVSIANMRLNYSTGFLPSVGTGENIFNLIGDCEQGSYCDLSTPGGGIGTCREQLPNSHNCTSYIQCISLRCNELISEPSRTIIGKKRGIMDLYHAIRANISPRATLGSTVCFPSKINKGGEGTGTNPGDGLGTGDDGGANGGVKPGALHSSSGFPSWMGIIFAMIAILGAALIFGLTRRRKKFNEKRMLKPMRNLDERVRARSMPLPPNSSDGKTGYSRGTNTKSESRGPMFGNFLGFSKTSGQHVAETNEKIDTMCISAELKDADIFSVNDASLISIGTGTDYSNNQFSVDELSANASPAVLPPQSSTDTKPNSLNSSNGFHYGGRGLSINIPQITTTHLESQSPSPSSDLSSAWSMFEDGESPQTTQHYPESLAPIPNEIRAPADSSIYDPSISESSSAFSRNSSHRFLSTPPLTSPNLSLGTTVSPVSPVSPISPRPSLSSGPSSRLSHRQSTQARKL